MISGTTHEKKVLEWKETHCVSFCNDAKEKPMVLGKGYWVGFMKQNKHLVKARKGVKFVSKRANWCTHQNFQLIHEEVYEAMVLGGIASKLDTPFWFDKAWQRRGTRNGRMHHEYYLHHELQSQNQFHHYHLQRNNLRNQYYNQQENNHHDSLTEQANQQLLHHVQLIHLMKMNTAHQLWMGRLSSASVVMNLC